MANELIYQSDFTGQQMDERFRAVATLAEALTVLEQAIAAKYTKPDGGIPATDLDADVNAALAKANSAIQSLADYYTKSEVDAMVAAVNAQEYIDVATLPAASADTLGKIYLVGPTSGEYARYITTVNGSTYGWVQIGTTEISMANYATKAELSQLDQKTNGRVITKTTTGGAIALGADSILTGETIVAFSGITDGYLQLRSGSSSSSAFATVYPDSLPYTLTSDCTYIATTSSSETLKITVGGYNKDIEQLQQKIYGRVFKTKTNGTNKAIDPSPIPAGSVITDFSGLDSFYLRRSTSSSGNIVNLTKDLLPYTLAENATYIYTTTSNAYVTIVTGGTMPTSKLSTTKEIKDAVAAATGTEYKYKTNGSTLALSPVIPKDSVITWFEGFADDTVVLRSSSASGDNMIWLAKDRLPFKLPAAATHLYCATNNLDIKIYAGGIREDTDLAWKRQWFGKTAVLFGDSITAQGNSDLGSSYFGEAAKKHNIDTLVRGVGGQKYVWNTNGFYTKHGDDGSYVNRYLAVDGVISVENGTIDAANYTAQQKSDIEAVLGYEVDIHYGAFCAWGHLTGMIPDAIREDIDLIVICGGTNDVPASADKAEPTWVANSVTDPDWAADTLYNGGDYDVTTFNGAIASAIMKCRVWCPNAVVVIATPFPRFNKTTLQLWVNVNGVSMRETSEIEMYVAGILGAEVIDANGKAGISGVTFDDYTGDDIHPNSAGLSLFGRAFPGELVRIYPKLAGE